MLTRDLILRCTVLTLIANFRANACLVFNKLFLFLPSQNFLKPKFFKTEIILSQNEFRGKNKSS